MYDMSSDIQMSALAFFGLASMVFCYWDGNTKLVDYVLFAIIFFIFGYYCNYLFGEQYAYYPIIGGALYAIGVIFTLIFNKEYRTWCQERRKDKAQNNP